MKKEGRNEKKEPRKKKEKKEGRKKRRKTRTWKEADGKMEKKRNKIKRLNGGVQSVTLNVAMLQ